MRETDPTLPRYGTDPNQEPFSTFEGKATFSYTVTTKKYSPFDARKLIVTPGPPLKPLPLKGGSFSLSYVGRQFLVERGKDDGWGVFTQLSIADDDTSPVTRFFDVGLGGNDGASAHRLH